MTGYTVLLGKTQYPQIDAIQMKTWATVGKHKDS